MGKTLSFTSIALICFAANSVLCRMALGNHEIDANSFTLLRLLSGSVMLLLLSSLSGTSRRQPAQQQSTTRGSWLSGYFLFQYAICFSLAYTVLSAATGAIILFAAVQITMIVVSLLKGSRLHYLEWLGVALAFAGFVFLLFPGISAPSPLGFLLMLLSGISWGAYTLRGRRSTAALNDSTWNFIRSLPFILITLVFFWNQMQFNQRGVLLAIASGAIASGVGYAIWYKALTRLSTIQAAVVQLLVPLLTAIAGIVWIAEPISLRLLIASVIILGGILLVILKPYYVTHNTTQ